MRWHSVRFAHKYRLLCVPECAMVPTSYESPAAPPGVRSEGAVLQDEPAASMSQAPSAKAPWNRMVASDGSRRAGLWSGLSARGVRSIGLRRALVAGLLLAWSIGAVLFLRADGSVYWSLPRAATPPRGEHNLAFYRWGPTLRASSYYREPFSHHHPIFLVDARAEPHEVEKWTSGFHDHDPWLELAWREPRQLARVVIYHAGWREHGDLTVRRYRMTCLQQGGATGPSLHVTDNHEAVATHPLACERAVGVRFEWTPNRPDDHVRVYEIEAWGR